MTDLSRTLSASFSFTEIELAGLRTRPARITVSRRRDLVGLYPVGLSGVSIGRAEIINRAHRVGRYVQFYPHQSRGEAWHFATLREMRSTLEAMAVAQNEERNQRGAIAKAEGRT